MENVTEFSVVITAHKNGALNGELSVQITMPDRPDAFFVSNKNQNEEDLCFDMVSDSSENIHNLEYFRAIMDQILDQIDRKCQKLKE
jgi:hypothetical protein